MAIRTWKPESRIRGLQTVKFLQPVTPGSRFSITLEMLSPGKITFRCSAGQKLFNTGTVILQTPPGPE
jgi:3-hydroxymyristoyl/3-hydroxydecanoyl-(acyl carrier protein) dehydratase